MMRMSVPASASAAGVVQLVQTGNVSSVGRDIAVANAVSGGVVGERRDGMAVVATRC